MPQINKKIVKGKGSALLEMAIVLPVLLLIFIGMIEFSLLFYNKAILTNASREGARYGIVFRNPSYATTTAITNYAKAYCQNKLISFSKTATLPTATAVMSVSPPVFGATLTVTVSYVYTYLLLPKFITSASQITLQATTVMTYE